MKVRPIVREAMESDLPRLLTAPCTRGPFRVLANLM